MYALTPEQTKPGTALRSILSACVPFRDSRIGQRGPSAADRLTSSIGTLLPIGL
jgi:hypothetical protein